MQIEKEIVQTEEFENEYQKTLVNVLFTQSWVMTNLRRILLPMDITPQQYNVLRILRGQYPNPARLTLVKDRVIDRMSDVSRIIERLVKKGLVERTHSEIDRRAINLIITNAGLELLDEVNSDELLSFFASNLNKTEAETLNYLLDKMRDHEN